MMMVIMKWLCKRKKKPGLYGPFGPILSILAAENGKTKKQGCPEPNYNLL